ncbi:MAG: hypothetical protein LBJ02_08290 [Bifidobacteriaceae bacterium]|nr:hypothetical protein [Bifidobacteriaceae bacterium]
MATPRGGATLAVIVLVASGCASGGGENGRSEGGNPAPASGAGFEGSGYIDIDGDTPFSSYSPYLDGPGVDEEALVERKEQWWDSVEASVSECMAREGFEYFPTEYLQLQLPDDALSFDVDWMPIPALPGKRDEVEQWGYGSHSRLTSFTPADLQSQLADAPSSRANSDYFASLSPDAQTKYTEAYQGSEEALYDRQGVDLYAGCSGQAFRAFPEPGSEEPQYQFDAEFGELVHFIASLSSIIFEDKRISGLASEWNDCMRKAGVDVSGEIVADVVGGDGLYANPRSAWYLAMRTGEDGNVGPGGEGFFEDSLPLDQRSLTGSGPEVRIALADFDCRVETDYVARFKEIQLGIERQFVDENRARLDQMVAAAQG